MSDVSREEWLTSPDTHLLKKKLAESKENAIQRLLGVAGNSSDPKCSELAREIRKITEFITLLSPEKKDAERNS